MLEDEADNEDNEESSTPIKTDTKPSDEEAKRPKRVKSLVLSSQPEEVEGMSYADPHQLFPSNIS